MISPRVITYQVFKDMADGIYNRAFEAGFQAGLMMAALKEVEPDHNIPGQAKAGPFDVKAADVAEQRQLDELRAQAEALRVAARNKQEQAFINSGAPFHPSYPYQHPQPWENGNVISSLNFSGD